MKKLLLICSLLAFGQITQGNEVLKQVIKTSSHPKLLDAVKTNVVFALQNGINIEHLDEHIKTFGYQAAPYQYRSALCESEYLFEFRMVPVQATYGATRDWSNPPPALSKAVKYLPAGYFYEQKRKLHRVAMALRAHDWIIDIFETKFNRQQSKQ